MIQLEGRLADIHPIPEHTLIDNFATSHLSKISTRAPHRHEPHECHRHIENAN